MEGYRLVADVLQFDIFVSVVRVRAGNSHAGPVASFEGDPVVNHHGKLASGKIEAAEDRINVVREAHEAQIDGFIPNVGQFNGLFVRVLRVVHDLGDAQILGAGPDRVYGFVQRAPRHSAQNTGPECIEPKLDYPHPAW